ncbi:uncharacterized protein BJ171DRAFT_508551 [Polychytrium aggregatum]|uniref:uncharacterized protein n=1 Tax=Polychytrium aggregatum TaxID=110093 RepID=UPI0022FE2CD5|nr:uncharacterized protein BJ171DRAFT_508551 [Polychytrium aggregatum]KAI9203882.1 hypothetical protein BJ171DRAFT_508551 [Polychytrium aggregatum]
MDYMPKMPPPGTTPRQAVPITLPPEPVNQRLAVTLDSNHTFEVPTKRIHTTEDVAVWLKSEACARFVEFVQVLNVHVKNKKISDPCAESKAVSDLVGLLTTLSIWVDEIPPLEGPKRFGNRAFKIWYEKMESNVSTLLLPLVPPALDRDEVLKELTPYFTGSFGHSVRLDYGSGHELSFVAFLLCLDILQVVGPDDFHALVTRVFVKYLDLVRKIQTTYSLEPAGSHGVWGLDDHQFLPYFWGSGQLQDHPRLRPKSIMQVELVDHFYREYLYFGCIKFINETKRGPFHEHSPLLYDISGVPTWTKVNSGILKMYIAEVLMKFPVVQHLPFGSLLPFREAEHPIRFN